MKLQVFTSVDTWRRGHRRGVQWRFGYGGQHNAFHNSVDKEGPGNDVHKRKGLQVCLCLLWAPHRLSWNQQDDTSPGATEVAFRCTWRRGPICLPQTSGAGQAPALNPDCVVWSLLLNFPDHPRFHLLWSKGTMASCSSDLKSLTCKHLCGDRTPSLSSSRTLTETLPHQTP